MLVIVDQYTKFTWVYFLFKKDETPEILPKHVKLIENGSNHKVKILRSDNGTKFKKNQMNELCKYNGISHQFSTPGTPQQNGVVERKNRTLIEAGRTMLQEAKLPTYFWEEAINIVCFTQNCTLINRHGVTPYQMLKGKKPSLKHLHIFGCKCFVLQTHPEQLGKFETKGDEGIFVGYPLITRAFKVYNLRTRTVIESINVSYDDGKITGIDGESHEDLVFGNDIDKAGIVSNPNDVNPDVSNPDDTSHDDVNPDEYEDAHFLEEHVHDIGNSHSSSGHTESTEGSSGTDNSNSQSNTEGSSNTDDTSNPDDSLRNGQGNNSSGGASEETQESSFEDETDAWGASNSRQQLPPARKWTKDHTPGLIIGVPEAGVLTRSATQNECLFHNFLSQQEPNKVEDAHKDSDWVAAM